VVFWTTSEEGIAVPSSEVNTVVIGLVPFSGEDRFRIRAGNFADRDPTDATNQGAEQK
jgi:hypothetical protein